MATSQSRGNVTEAERKIIKRGLVFLIASLKRAINTESDDSVRELRSADLIAVEAFASKVNSQSLDLG